MKNELIDLSNDSWLDELVGGNLQGDQYRKALQVLDAQPQRWRDCALAFLQEQALTQELQGLARGDVSWRDSNPPVDPTAVQGSTQHKSPAIEISRDLKVSSQNPNELVTLAVAGQVQEQFNVRSMWLQRLTSLAAMLLISFTIGWVGSDLLRKSGASKETTGDLARKAGTVSGFGPTVQAVTDAPLSPTFSQDDFRLVAERFVPIDRKVPEELRDLERRGMIRIESSDAFLPMDLGNGSSAIVPVQQYRVTPVIYTY